MSPAMERQYATRPPDLTCYIVYLRYLSTSFLWWQVVAGIIGVTSSTALRSNSRCPSRHSEGARHVYNTPIRRALSSLHPCGSVTADVHGCPRGVTLIRHPIPRDALPARLSYFRLLAMASPHRMLVGSY